MGNNIDFFNLFSIPNKIKCKCGKILDKELEEWDIDCSTDHEGSKYKLKIDCEKCGDDNFLEIELNPKVVMNGKEVKETNNICGECGKVMKSKQEIEFGQCDKCCAWKYRDSCD